jgi:fatty acid desaturase
VDPGHHGRVAGQSGLDEPVVHRPPAKAAFNESALAGQIMRLRGIDNVTNLAYLAGEYLCLAAVIGGTILFCESRGTWGLARAWDVPVVALAVVLVGGLQHRLAGLGHEASHYTLFKNRVLNDLAGDLLCLFPIVASLQFYRLFHLAHHQFTNDPERDPDLASLGPGKMVGRFPMSRWQFIKSFYLRPLTDPRAFLKYQREYIDINVLGRSENVYLRRVPGLSGADWPRLGTTLGLIYLFAFVAGLWIVTAIGRPAWLVWLGVAGTLLVLGVGSALPSRAFFRSPLRQPLSARSAGLLRLCYCTWCLVALRWLGIATGGRSAFYVYLLWILPLCTTLCYFMLLRDVYQHTNADDGRLTNTRVFLVDPFTRWAIFVYGQDMHVPHHLFPGIPHYRLPRFHGLLKERHADYAARVVECHGTFANREGLPTILDVMAAPPPANAGAPRG